KIALALASSAAQLPVARCTAAMGSGRQRSVVSLDSQSQIVSPACAVSATDLAPATRKGASTIVDPLMLHATPLALYERNWSEVSRASAMSPSTGERDRSSSGKSSAAAAS